MIKKVIIITILVFWVLVCAKEEEVNNKYVIGWTTSETDTINGVGICFERGFEDNTVNGLDLQVLGTGWVRPILGGMGVIYLGKHYYTYKDSINYEAKKIEASKSLNRSKTNGLVISLMGSMNEYINGVSIGGIAGRHEGILNGISVNAYLNDIEILNGLSIALFNSSGDMTGCQLGLVNVADMTHGVQFGIIGNFANKVNGLQLGLINYTDILNGCQIGLFNMYHNQTVKQDEMSFRVGWPVLNWNF